MAEAVVFLRITVTVFAAVTLAVSCNVVVLTEHDPSAKSPRAAPVTVTVTGVCEFAATEYVADAALPLSAMSDWIFWLKVVVATVFVVPLWFRTKMSESPNDVAVGSKDIFVSAMLVSVLHVHPLHLSFLPQNLVDGVLRSLFCKLFCRHGQLELSLRFEPV